MSDQKTSNVVVAGLGGQGVLKCSDILAEALFRAGYDVKKSEIHGMSQRGGSVTSDVRFGERVYSPMVPYGEADYLIVLDRSQIELNRPVLQEVGVLITPDDIGIEQLDNPKSLNVALLGVFSCHTDVDEKIWFETIESILPPMIRDANRAAFALGRNAVNAVTKTG